MKKKVRIYKAPDGKGKFVNKTAKFLSKAQEGGQQDKQAQLADYVYKTLDDAEPFEFESIKESLINELASAQIPIDQAEGMVENIAAGLSNETAQADELAGQEEAGMYDQAQEDLRAQEEAAAAAEEERQAGLAEDYGYYDDTAAQGEDEEDEEDYDDEEDEYQMGGDLIPEPNAVSFLGYDPEQYAKDSMNSYSQGGITKRKYIGSVMKMLKKQDGGEGEKDSQMDPMDTASNEKKRKKDAFIGALASSAKEAKMKEQAEAMWQQQQQAMMQQQAPQYSMQAPMEEVPMAQRGMSVRQMRRMMPRGFGRNQMQSFAGMVPQGGMFPMGMNIMTYPQMQMPEQKPIHVQGTPQGLKLDVRKSNWLTGRPSQYSIEFGGDAAIPGFNMMPGVGYGSKSKQRKTIEGVSKLVNKIADPVNDINKDKAGYDVDGNGVPDNIQSNQISTTSNLSEELDKNRNGILDTTEVATNLPGTTKAATNLNKDAGGKGSNLPTKSSTAKTNTATASKNVGQTKGAVSKAPVTNKGVINKQSKGVATSRGDKAQESDFVDTKTAVKKVQPKSIPANSSSWTDNFATSWDEVGQNAQNFGNRLKKGWDANVEMASDLGERVKKGWNSNWGAWTGLQFEQDGGFVDSTNPDLYKFIYGGNEQFPDPITQQDMNYADSKNTASPYFANGGYVKYQTKGEVKDWDKDGDGVPDNLQVKKIVEEKKEEKKEEPKKSEFQAITSKEDYDKRLAEERKKWQEDNAPEDQQQYSGNYSRTGYPQNAFNRYFPANTIRKLGTYSQQMGMPYGASGAAYTGGFGPNTNLTKIDVRKSGWLSGRPKKYTMHFNNYSVDPALSKYLDESEGAAGSGEGSANTADLNSKGINPETGTSFTPKESQTWRERRQNKAYDKFMAEGYKMADEDSEEEGDINGPMTEEEAKAAANQKMGPYNYDDNAPVPKENISQDVSALNNANASGVPDYNQTQDMMSQLDEARFNAAQDQLSKQEQSGSMTQEQAANVMANNPFMPGYNANQQMNPNDYADETDAYSDYTPGFGDDMSGAPMINGAISPWSLPEGFTPNGGMEQGDGSGAAPFAENLPFAPQGDESDMFGYGIKGQAARQQQRQIQQQKQQQQQKQNNNQSSNRDVKARATQAQNSNRQTARNAGNDFNIKGVINSAKGDLSGFKDSELGAKTMFAIDQRWQKMSKAQKKNYGDYKNYLKVEGYDKFANAMNSKQFGGDGNLNRFIYGDEVTKTSTGQDSPVSNINNPTHSFLRYDDSGKLVIPGLMNPEEDKKQKEMKLSLYKGYGEGDDFSAAPAGSTFTKDEEGNDVVISPEEARKRIEENSFAVDFKNKNAYEVDAQGVLNSANAGARGALNFFEKRGQKKANKNFYDRFTADNLYAGDPIRDRGDYEANSGLYRPDEQGQTWNSRSAKYGGFMQAGGFVEGDVVDMTPEEIEEFLANGGELEMIS